MRDNIPGFAVLALVIAMTVAGTGAEARETSTATQKTGGEAVGASVAHPEQWFVEREQFTYDDTFGYTLWRPDNGEPHDHGGKPALRVALAYDMKPGDIEDEVGEIFGDYSDLSMKRETVAVAREHEGVAVGPIPGSTPSTEVYVPVNGRVYRINVYAGEPGQEGLGEGDRVLLSGLRFSPPSRSVGSLDLPRANAPEVLYPSPGEVPPETTKVPEGEEPASLVFSRESSDATAARGGSEQRIKGGCWLADPNFYVQTIHGYKANSNKRDNIPTGWSVIGSPNFWGQYTHGNLGYGRCNEPDWANDKYAVDYPLNKGDVVFSPFSCGKVTFAGRNRSHADYGIFVTIKACNGKYVSLQGHLNGLRSGLSRGDRVTEDKIIGYAGDTGGGNIPVGRPHVHQAYYRYPEFLKDGSPYGGSGLKVDRIRYVGTAARRQDISTKNRRYEYGRVRPSYGIFCKEYRTCGEGYRVSN